MNPGPGSLFKTVWLILCAATLTASLSAAAQQQNAPGIPGFFPGQMANPYPQFQNQAPRLQNYNPALVPQQPYGTRPHLVPQQPYGTTPHLVPQQPYGTNPAWGYPANPAARGFPQHQAPQAKAAQPYIEVKLESTKAYVHQNLVMTILVISTGNLKTAAAQLQDTEDTIFRQLGDPTVSTRQKRGQREIVNTLYYQLTPLRSGHIELEPVRVSGITEGGTSYEAAADRKLHLRVSEPDPSVQPWLPLHELELSAALSNDEQIGEGKPLTISIEQRAVGMSGAQLPSPEAQLRGPGHRLYREGSDYEGTISKQGTLIGIRKDRFTLVPQQGNQVEIPAIRLAWWNVERQRKETAVIPGRLLNDRGQGPGEDGDRAPGAGSASWVFWVPMLLIAFLIGRLSPILTPGLGRAGRWLWYRLAVFTRPLRRRFGTVLGRLSPRRNLHRLRRTVADSLPRSSRLWFCVRNADGESDPDDWCQVLRFLVNRRLNLPAHLPMSRLAEHIIDIHPGADPDKIQALFDELQAAQFGGQPMRDFDAWKDDFKRQVRPRLFSRFRRRQRQPRSGILPSLNPA